MVTSLDYKGIEFSVSKKSYHKIETKNNSSFNEFGYEYKHVYLIYR